MLQMINKNSVSNYHTHTEFSDGSHQPEVYVEEAISLGFKSFGFSDHSPLPFENRFAIQNHQSLLDYSSDISRLKQKYKSQINIYLGIEADFIPGVTQSFNSLRLEAKLDYVIGGVHLVKKKDEDRFWFIDGPKIESYDQGLFEIFDGNIVNAVKTYYLQLMEMIDSEKPDIVAHPDKITMHNQNRYFNGTEKWYTDSVAKTLDLIKQNNTIVEVNTRGIYKKRSDSLFPGIEILKQIRQMNIPIILSSDAHNPSEIASQFEETVILLKTLGFHSIHGMAKNGWQPMPL